MAGLLAMLAQPAAEVQMAVKLVVAVGLTVSVEPVVPLLQLTVPTHDEAVRMVVSPKQIFTELGVMVSCPGLAFTAN